MKKTGLTMLGLLAGIYVCLAGVVTPGRSAEVAKTFFAGTKAGGSSALQLVASMPVSDNAAPNEAPALYVYARETGGYVIIAGEEAAIPVLAYSETGRFPSEAEMPDNMRAMLELYAREIGFARAHGWEPDAANRQRWENPTVSTKASEAVVLETANWNQWKPYNDLCPKVDGQEVPCGCVATAMAIIMRYHKWPAKGTGTIPGYDYGWNGGSYAYHQDGITLGHTYDWDKMPLSYGSSYSQEAGFQVAQLIRDLGIMCQMNYAPDGSGAGSASPINMATYFGYDKQMRYLDRESFSDERWEALIRKEIDEGRPVFHCGSSSRGGHAFVMDGYRDRYFHINYGWGGSSNNYYTVTPIEGHTNELMEFNKWQDMVTHIMPDQGGDPYVSLEYGGQMSPFVWDFRSDSFQTGWNYLYRIMSTGDGPTEVCYCLYDREGNLKETLSDPFVVVNTDNSWYIEVPSVSCKAPANAADGDCVKLSRKDDFGQWEPLPQTRRNYLMFDCQRPLSELVSVGHTFGWATNWDATNSPNFFIHTYKDIYWELRTPDGIVLATSANITENPYYSDNKIWMSSYYNFPNNDSQGDHPYFEFFISSGEYELFFRNFNEEMTLHITL